MFNDSRFQVGQHGKTAICETSVKNLEAASISPFFVARAGAKAGEIYLGHRNKEQASSVHLFLLCKGIGQDKSNLNFSELQQKVTSKTL